MKTRVAVSFVIVIALSFLSLCLMEQAVHAGPGPIEQREKSKSIGALPDLVVDSIWLDNQCSINFKLKNSGAGNIPDAEHKESAVRVQFGSEIKDFSLPKVDPSGVLKKAGGLVSFNTQIPLKSSVDVKVIVDFTKKIKESDAGEKNNEKVAKLTPQCPTVAQVDAGAKAKTSVGKKADVQKSAGQKIPSVPIGVKADTASIDITILSPTQNSTWDVGSSLKIQWKVMAPTPIFHVLLKTPGMADTASTSAGEPAVAILAAYQKMQPDAQGFFNYDWQIPSYINPGDYIVKVRYADDPKVFSKSGVFKINPEPIAVIKGAFTKLPSPGINVVNPAQDATWELGKSYQIQWKSMGYGLSKVNIALFTEKGALAQQVGSGPDKGTYDWKVPSGIPNGKYFMRISTSDNKISGDSKVFDISDGKLSIVQGMIPGGLKSGISVTNPKKGDVWIPLKPCTIKWTFTYDTLITKGTTQTQSEMTQTCTGLSCAGVKGCLADVWLVPANTSDPSNKILLKSNICAPGDYSQGKMTITGEYNGLVPNLQSGNYFVRVALSNKPSFYGDSQAFSVKSVLSSGAAYLGPDASQGQVDLALEDVFFDGQGNILMKVKNLGADYAAPIKATYEIVTFGTEKKLLKKDAFFTTGDSLKAGETKVMTLTSWGGFTFSTEGWDGGIFIPVNSRPLWITVKIMPTGGDDFNVNNNQISKKLCMIQTPDIGTDGRIHFIFGLAPKNDIWIFKGTTNQIHESQLKWVTNDTFEANLDVGLWNYGCTGKTFDSWLYVDNLPGQLLKKLTLNSGEKGRYTLPAKIKLPSKCGDHNILFVADPDENKNEPYPNAYMNNFINVTLKILCEGTIWGH